MYKEKSTTYPSCKKKRIKSHAVGLLNMVGKNGICLMQVYRKTCTIKYLIVIFQTKINNLLEMYMLRNRYSEDSIGCVNRRKIYNRNAARNLRIDSIFIYIIVK